MEFNRSNFMLNSVRAKLLMLVVAMVMVTVTATTLIHVYLFRTHQDWSLRASTLAVGISLRTLLEHTHGQKLILPAEIIDHYCSEMKSIHPELAAVGVVDALGNKLFGDVPNAIVNLRDNGILAQIWRGGHPQFVETKLDPPAENITSTAALVPIRGSNNLPEIVLVVLRSDAVVRNLGILIFISLGAGGLVALVVAALGHWGTDFVVMCPLKKLLRAIQEVTARGEEAGGRVEIGNTDELRTLGQAFNDMLERLERSRAALKSNESFLETIIENIPILLEVQDANDLRYVRFNRAGEAMIDLRREELLGRTPQEIFPAEAAIRYVARDQAILAAGVPVDVPEERIQTQAFGERIFYTRKIPIFDEERQLKYLLGISEDITERRHLEEVRRFGAFQAGIAEMSVSVLHNIGNAITTVTEDAEQIVRGAEDLGRVAALLNTDADRTAALLATKEASRANPIATRLLTVQREIARTINRIQRDGLQERAARIGRSVAHITDIVHIQQSAALPGGGASTFSLQRVIEDAMVMQGESLVRHEVAITVNIDPKADEITTYRNRLLQALLNLLKNSYEAIRERQSEEMIPGQITITGQPLGNGRMKLHIVDNGIGIDSHALQDIFHFGYSTKARGSGFGLHSVANFIQEQGGSIEAHSSGRKQGAEFIIELPLRVTRD